MNGFTPVKNLTHVDIALKSSRNKVVCRIIKKFTKHMWKERSLSNAMSAIQLFPKKEIWKGILNQFMKVRSHSHAAFATHLLLQKIVWTNTSKQFMRRRSYLFKRNDCTLIMELCFWDNTVCKYLSLHHAIDNKILMPNIVFVENVFFTVGIGLSVVFLKKNWGR